MDAKIYAVGVADGGYPIFVCSNCRHSLLVYNVTESILRSKSKLQFPSKCPFCKSVLDSSKVMEEIENDRKRFH